MWWLVLFEFTPLKHIYSYWEKTQLVTSELKKTVTNMPADMKRLIEKSQITAKMSFMSLEDHNNTMTRNHNEETTKLP